MFHGHDVGAKRFWQSVNFPELRLSSSAAVSQPRFSSEFTDLRHHSVLWCGLMLLVILLLALSAILNPRSDRLLAHSADKHGTNSRLIYVVYHSEAMTYSPTYSTCLDGGSQIQQTDPWDRTFEYAPTPGNFSSSPTPPRYSPALPQRYDEAIFQPIEQLQFIPLAAWKKENKYVKQPPICVHYLVE
jgi:hypothetical protein